MKIVHICLACFYIEGWGYQENILPSMHKDMGHEVSIITTDFKFRKRTVSHQSMPDLYINENGIKVRKVRKITERGYYYEQMKDFVGLYSAIEEERPDIIFVHGGQFIGLRKILKYCKRNPKVKLFIDNHDDYYNSPISTIKIKVLQKIIFGHWMRVAQKYCEKFWGVTPWRCEYLHEVYNISNENIGLLPMGGEDKYIHFGDQNVIRERIRRKYGISESDFLVITGGKIDRNKNIHLLAEAVINLNIDHVKLLVFGNMDAEMESVMLTFFEDSHIVNIGWINSSDVYDYYLSSDLACFPGTHSVLWEQAVASGIPLVVKEWYGMDHVDVGGNCIFISDVSSDSLKELIGDIYHDKSRYAEMKKAALEKGVAAFSYKEIAKKAIGLDGE